MDANPSTPKLRIENLSKVFWHNSEEVCALQDVSFDVPEHQFLVVLGPSGCGKTTLLRIVAGLSPPTEGTVYLARDGGLQTVERPDRALGMVFQSYTCFPWLTVERNIEFGLRLRGTKPAEREGVVRRYVDAFGLTGFENAYPKQLSGGMRQRVAIARTMAANPEVYLLDEPFGSLDAQTRSRMQLELLEVWKHHLRTVIFVTHDVEEAIFLADRIIILTARPGRVKTEVSIPSERPFQRPRPLELKTLSEFVDLRKQINELVVEESACP